jgi:hypothetical protein
MKIITKMEFNKSKGNKVVMLLVKKTIQEKNRA